MQRLSVIAPIRTPSYKVSDLSAQLAAVRAHMGLTILPCFIGDADRTLTRAQGCETEHYGKLWILTHGDTRISKRIRVFSNFIKQRIKLHSELLVGGALSERSVQLPLLVHSCTIMAHNPTLLVRKSTPI
ncbi:LysR family transcriptional regulator [Parasedimentitalea denitrificans]|uniref:LysR family transcriptional regulator n=1 Tax=Parasedimentitalea denitrificans TaxID=2211118 RepID=UPI00143073A2